jgi:cell division protein ZapA (FtsZ GTPase activity inhibitor)
MADSTLDITILGRTYKVACAEGERDALLRTAAYLDAKMGEIRNAGKGIRHRAHRRDGRAQHRARTPDDKIRRRF